MATNTTIEWADKTWSPIIGCDRVSPGCDRCYAIGVARIRESNPHPTIARAFEGTTVRTDERVDWSGRINLIEDRLTEPLRWHKPRKVFVNSLSDLFHKGVPDEYIAKVFAVMALTPQHTYQILTKRHGRMRSLLKGLCTCGAGHPPAEHFRSEMAWVVSQANPDRIPELPDDAEHRVYHGTEWPLPNVWLGCSVEDQKRADMRVPALLDTPAAVRFISAEPLLGPVDLDGPIVPGRGRPKLTYWLTGRPGPDHERAYTTRTGLTMTPFTVGPRLDWVIVGGESGHGARPMHPDWARSLRDQCQQADVPFLFKQHGQWLPLGPLYGDLEDTDEGHMEAVHLEAVDGKRVVQMESSGHIAEGYQPGDSRTWLMASVGKGRAGRELDGRTWDEYPKAVTA